MLVSDVETNALLDSNFVSLGGPNFKTADILDSPANIFLHTMTQQGFTMVGQAHWSETQSPSHDSHRNQTIPERLASVREHRCSAGVFDARTGNRLREGPRMSRASVAWTGIVLIILKCEPTPGGGCS
jgi:hypothetical protein